MEEIEIRPHETFVIFGDREEEVLTTKKAISGMGFVHLEKHNYSEEDLYRRVNVADCIIVIGKISESLRNILKYVNSISKNVIWL